MTKKLLIVGAGPVGLAAALFVSKNPQITIDIIEKNPNPRVMVGSKALGINPRTMSLFTGFPIQQKLLSICQRVKQFQILKLETQKVIVQNNFQETLSGITPYSNMFIYPQCRTQQLLQDQINSKGIQVQRGVQLLQIQNKNQGVCVKLNNSKDQKIYDYVLGSDGAHSAIRKKLKIPFTGQTLNDMLYVADYEYQGQQFNQARTYIGEKETILILPVIDNVLRIVGNSPNYQQTGKKLIKIGKKVWESKFKLNNRYVQKMNQGKIYLAGDAAHVHAPIGGRGMNLGIEDVFVFSHLLKEGRLHQYNDLRQPVVKQFVQKIMKASIILKHQRSIFRKVIPMIAPLAIYFGRKKATLFLTGLDHDIQQIPKL